MYRETDKISLLLSRESWKSMRQWCVEKLQQHFHKGNISEKQKSNDLAQSSCVCACMYVRGTVYVSHDEIRYPLKVLTRQMLSQR